MPVNVTHINQLLLVVMSAFVFSTEAFSNNDNVTFQDGDPLIANYYNDVAWEFRNSYPDSTIFYAEKALVLAKNDKNLVEELRAYNILGIAERNKSNYSKAFAHYMEVLKGSEDRPLANQQRGFGLINIGNLYIYQANYGDALEYFNRALMMADSVGDQRMQGYVFLNIGRTYRSMSQFEDAEEALVKSLSIREQLGDLSGIITLKVELAELYRLQGETDKSLEYFKASLDEINAIKNYGALSYSWNNISQIYREKDSLQLAEFYAKSALQVAEDVKSKYDVQKATENLSKIYEQQGKYELAYENLQRFNQVKDSIFNEENTREMERLVAKYEGEKVAAEADFLREQASLNEKIIKRQQVIIVLSVVGVLLFAGFFLVTLRAFRLRNKLNNEIIAQKNKIEHDKEIIEKQSRKLEELDAAKSRFFANISHDLRSPLSLILGSLDNVIREENNYITPTSKEDLDIGYKNSKRLLFLADEINELTKLEEGKLNINHEVVKINTYMNLLVRMFSSAADYKGIELVFDTTLNDEEVLKLDPAHFEKIVYNLVSNAINHTNKGGDVKIGLDKGNDKIKLTIADTGEGIPEKSIPLIFDRYYQSPNNKYKVREGLGIGLALVKELVTLHDAEINVKSEIDKGTAFEIYFPAYHAEEEGMIPEHSDYLKEKNNLWSELLKKNEFQAGKKHITVKKLEEDKEYTLLLVDDHPEVREYIKNLVIKDFTVVEATNGQEALDLLETEHVDLVVTDLMMPWMDGFELLEKMSEDSRLKKIPALVVSARTNEEDKQKVLFRGINDILYKPFNREELLLRIQNILSHKSDWEGESTKKMMVAQTETIDDIEKGIIEKLESVIIENINNPHLSVALLSDTMAASERKVYRMIKKLTGFTPLEYIKEVKWQYLEVLIREKKIKNPTEAAKSIGLQNVTKFKAQFEKKFGKNIDLVLDYGLE